MTQAGPPAATAISWRSKGLYGLMAFLCVGVGIYGLHYLIVPLAPPPVSDNRFYPWGLIVHATAASVALLVSPFQFVTKWRRVNPARHRWIGRVYVAGCLVGGLAGAMLAVGASTGPFSQAGFGLLAAVWLATTAQAWRLARARRFAEHRRWMIRSFALTFAAVTLRAYLPVAPLFGIDFIEGYRWISWLCWVPNLAVAELYLRWRPNPAAGAL